VGLIVQPGDARQRLVRGGLLALSLGLVLLPWMIRNLWVFGEPVGTTTHGGYTLALANNPVYYREVLNGPPGRVWTGYDQWLWWWPRIAAPMMGVGLTLVHAVFWTDLRMRAPMVPAIALVAAGARLPFARPPRAESARDGSSLNHG